MKSLSIGKAVLRWISGALCSDERDAVLGDLAEEGAGVVRSIVSVSYLVMRREFSAWNSVTPWVVLLLLLVPCGVLLAVVSQNLADGSAINVWLFANNWDRYLLHQPEFWSGLWNSLPDHLVSLVSLICWSWSCGFVVGSASPRTIQSSRILICVGCCLLWLGLIGIPHSAVFVRSARLYPGNSAVFRNLFYRSIAPLLAQMLLVLMPLLQGLRDAQRQGQLSTLRWLLVWSLQATALLSLSTQALAWWQFRTSNLSPSPAPHLPSLLPLALAGGLVFYLTHRWSRSHRPITT